MVQMLGQRVDRDQRLKGLGELPVVLELGGVQARPFLDEPQRACWQMAVEDLEGTEGDLSDVLAVLSVEMRRG